ncbi:MAG: 4-hydroxy-3-methylbut-2-enyl diphosphate reductase [bacterium]
MIKLFFANELGFCWGVERSIKLAAEAKNDHPGSVTILKEIVHNRQVVDFFKQKGVGQEQTLDKIEQGTLVISAHGVSPQVKADAEAKGLNIIDTTCPLVDRVHKITRKLIGEGYEVVLYGEPRHDEVMGVMGIAPDHIHLLAEYEDIDKLPKFERKVAVITQTTRGVKAFEEVCAKMRELYPDLRVEDTICNATEKRQEAVHELAPKVDLMLVIGSHSSGNSHRLRDIAEELCGRAYLLDSPEQLETDWFEGVEKVGLTAGASTPAFAIEMILRDLQERIGIDLANSDPKIFDYKTFQNERKLHEKAPRQ